MAIDFYDISDKKFQNHLFKIRISELDEIEEALQKLKKATGVQIDPYGDTNIYADHARLLAEFIKDLLNKPNVNEQVITRIYGGLSNVNEGFLAIGD